MSEVQILYYNEPKQILGLGGGGVRLNYHINLQFKKNSRYYIYLYIHKSYTSTKLFYMRILHPFKLRLSVHKFFKFAIDI